MCGKHRLPLVYVSIIAQKSKKLLIKKEETKIILNSS